MCEGAHMCKGQVDVSVLNCSVPLSFFLKMGVMPTHISVCHMHAWCPEEGATSLENL